MAVTAAEIEAMEIFIKVIPLPKGLELNAVATI